MAIGRAIVRQPKVFLFDEPLSNLDAQLRDEMRSEIKRLHQRLGATIIYVTHDQVEAMTLADRIAVLSAGRKMQYDTPDAHLQPAGGAVRRRLHRRAADEPGRLHAGRRAAADLGRHAASGCRRRWRSARNGAAGLKFGVRPENIALAPQAADDCRASGRGVAARAARRRDAGDAEDRRPPR